ncbi:hypothetical protein LXA43DRAFT_1067729 [Ganoderma leucocontextum]|nr:hypothetical protein LXA43DRAFT_1067729 [Ganoderma leucocontextum]
MTHEDVLASLTQGQPVNLPGREPNLPIFWRFETHELLEGVKGVKEVFIGAVDTRMEALLHSYFAAESRAFPDGTDKAVEAAGFLKLFPGNYVFLRDLNGDVLAMGTLYLTLVTGSWALEQNAPPTRPSKLMANMSEVSSMSVPILRSMSPTVTDALQQRYPTRSSERKPVRLLAFEGRKQNIIMTGQLLLRGTGSALHRRRDNVAWYSGAHYLFAGRCSGSDSHFGNGTRATTLALQRQADVINLPRIGYAGNYVFPTMQINIATTKPADHLAQGSFQRDLGQFAGKHIDANDSPGGTTCMITVNDLADNDQPGYFMIVQKGLVRSCFNGLFHHGGFPPTAPVGVHPQPWSYRCVIVCYPPRAMLDGDCNISYASLPRSHYHIAPEMIRPSPLISQASQDTMVPSTNCTSWLTEGPRLTTRDAYLQWFYQTQCQQLAFFARQAPPEVALEVDYNLLTQCFSLVDETGQKIQPHSWDLRPGSTHISPVLGCSRQETMQLWHDHNEDQGKFIPYCALLRADKSLVSSVKAEYFSDTQPSESGSANEDVRTSESDAPDASIGCDHPERRTHLLRRRSQRSSLRTSDTELSESSTSSGQQEPRAQTPKRSHKKARLNCVMVPSKSHIGRPIAGPIVIGPGRSSTGRAPHHLVLWHLIRLKLLKQKPDCNDYLTENVTDAHFPTSENLLFDFDWQSICNQDGMDEMLDFEAPNCSQESFALVPYSSTGADNQTPAYDEVLQIFSLVSLNTQLLKFEQLAHSPSKVPDVAGGDKSVETFLELFQLGNRFCPAFISEVTNVWTSIHKRTADLSLWSFKLAMEPRRIMLCAAAAWYWLTQDCPHMAADAMETLLINPTALEDTEDWLKALVRDIFRRATISGRGVIRARDYLPLGNDKDDTFTVPAHWYHRPIDEVVIEELTKALRCWLSFPNNTELIAAYFVIHLV